MTWTSGASALLGVLGAAVPVLVLLYAIHRTRREPRRVSNGFWLLAGALLVLHLAVQIGVPGAELVVTLIFLALVAAPLLVVVLAVFLLANGVTMLRRERRSLANMLSLLAGLGLLVVAGAPLLVLLAPSPWLVTVVMFLVLTAAYAGFVFFGFLLYSWLYPRLVRRWPADWVVVLGSGLIGSQVPPLLAGRIAAGQTAYAERGAEVLVMSGGQGGDERRPEAEAMAEWAVTHGTDPGVVLVENRSRSTEENLRFSAELVAARVAGTPHSPRGLIVTSDYHVLRAAVLARRLGIPAQATGVRTARYYWPSAVLREFAALVVERRWLHIVLGSLVVLPVTALFAVAGGLG